MIPKIFHQIWLWGKPLPKDFQKYQKTWQYYNPDWQLKIWNENNIETLSLFNKQIFLKLVNFSEKSDYIRYLAVYDYGGIYIDTDFECLKNIDHLADNFSCFFPQEICWWKKNICWGIFGAKRKNQLILNIILGITNRLNWLKKQTPSHIKIWPVYLQEIVNSNLITSNACILEPEIFFSYSFDDFRKWKPYSKCITVNSLGIHHYTGSWWPLHTRLRFFIYKTIIKYFVYTKIIIKLFTWKIRKNT